MFKLFQMLSIVILLFSCTLRKTTESAVESAKPPSRATQPSDYRKMFQIMQTLLSRPQATRFLHTVFRDNLKVDTAVQKEFGLPSEIKEVTSAQFLALLQANKSFWP